MYKFIKTPDKDNQFDVDSVEITTDSVSLMDLIQSFEYFLRGCGFQFNGSLEIQEEETESEL